jgi:serine/threonine protein kinase
MLIQVELLVKIADFGISKRAEDATATYSTVKGTPGFMPPESLDHSSDELSTAADIWALGEIAHMMLTSQPTFKNTRELFQFADGQKEFPQESLRDHNASTTAIQFISASMNANPDERLNAAQASKHEWMAKFAPQSPRPASISSSG